MSTSKRRRVIAGNWKMYKNLGETRDFFAAFLPLVQDVRHHDIVVIPPFTAISAAVERAAGSVVAIGAQDVYWGKNGALTGEICAGMLADAGCRYVLVGHSERRQFFHETDDTVARKALAVLSEGLTPIVCVGETLDDRDAGLEKEVLRRQFSGGPGSLTADEFSRI